VIGRERSRALVRELVAATGAGAGATVLIEGEAGIGKTELARSMAQEAAALGCTVLRGGAHPFERNRPFGPVAEALGLRAGASDPRRAAVGALLHGAPVGPGERSGRPPTDVRYRVIQGVVELLEAACAASPVLLVLEDLHWADRSTLAAFGSLAHELRDAPLLLVGTLRPSPSTPDLDLLIEDRRAAGGHVVRLSPLVPLEVQGLVEDLLGGRPGPVLGSIVDRAGGNPLWLVELVRSLTSEGWLRRDGDVIEAMGHDLPESLRALVLRRLQYLPAGTLELLRTASVLGDAVSVHDLSVVSGRPAPSVVDDLGEAFRARLLDSGGDVISFRHQLVQQAIYEELPKPVRRARHRSAAAALATSGAELTTVASHALLGADAGDAEAVGWLRAAAAEAIAGAPSVAADLLRRAGELLPAAHADADLLVAELADALLSAGEVAEAAAVAEAALARPHRAESAVPLQLVLVSALSLQNRTAELIDRAEQVLSSPSLQLHDRALVLTQASWGRTFSGDPVGGEATATKAFDAAERAGDTAMAVWSLCARSVPVGLQGRHAEAVELGHEVVRRAFEPVSPAARLRHPHFFLAFALAGADRLDEARAVFARAIQESEELGTAWLLPDMLLLSAEVQLLVGAWDDAEAELEAGLELARAHGQRITLAQTHAYRSLMASARGDRDGARAFLADVEDELDSANPAYGAELVGLAAAVVAEDEGDRVRAYDLLLRFWELDRSRRSRQHHRWLAPPLVRLADALGHADVARAVVDDVAAGAELAPEVPSVQGLARRCRGLVARDAEAALAAVELARRSGRLLDHAGACEDGAAVLLEAGRRAEAQQLLADAHAAYTSVGADAWAGRVAAELRRLGVRTGPRGPRPRAATGWDSLSERELAVSALVAEGLTNRQVAQRLHVSPHTVNTHLRHVFQKLGVATRAELAALVVRRAQITRSSDVAGSTERDPRS
jgi:DNA-binding CsgD family transcriptional regulator